MYLSDIYCKIILKIIYFIYWNSVESTALRLITGLGSGEVQSQLSKFLNEPKTIVSAESEELNRALVLTLARSMHITGSIFIIYPCIYSLKH